MKKKKGQEIGFMGSNTAVSQMLSCIPDGRKEAPNRRVSSVNSYDMYIYCIYVHLCIQTQTGTTVKVVLS